MIALLLEATAFAVEGDFSLNHPERLWLLWLLPLVVGFLYWRAGSRVDAVASFSKMASARGGLGVADKLNLLAVVAMVLALVDFQYGFEWTDVERSGVDMVIAIDVSDSMLVRDGGGQALSRLTRAKHEIEDLLERMAGDRVALVAFSGAAYLQCPLTLDYGAAALFLRGVDTNLISQKGTAIGAALRTSARALARSPEGSRAVLLITDGEDHSGDALSAAKDLAEEGIRVFVIGIGKPEGSPIPAENGSLRRDKNGDLVLSKLDEPTLQQIARETGGVYVRSVTGDIDLQSIYEEGVRATMEVANQTSVRKKRWFHRFQWFVALALLALLGSSVLSIRNWEGK